MGGKLECPKCHGEVRSKAFKSWEFRKYHVGRYECEHCKARFNLYDGPESTFTIPKGVGGEVTGRKAGA